VTTAADVGDLVEEIKKELPSLRDVDSDTITLQLASADGTLITAKDGAGKEGAPVTLSSEDTVDEALKNAVKQAGREVKPGNHFRIIVGVTAPAPSPLAASAAALRAQAQVLRDLRAAWAQSSPLTNLAKLALSSNGLTPLYAGSTTATIPPPSLAEFHIPGAPNTVMKEGGPKGLEELMVSGGSILLEEGRLRVSQKFMKAITPPPGRGGGKFGLLLSGPNGAGKLGKS
jgi:hypothetical protein